MCLLAFAVCVSSLLQLDARDACAGLLIPLNECRRSSLYLPWSCKHERHAYELCQYKLYMARVAKQTAAKESQ